MWKRYSSCFQSGEGPSRGLLRDCATLTINRFVYSTIPQPPHLLEGDDGGAGPRAADGLGHLAACSTASLWSQVIWAEFNITQNEERSNKSVEQHLVLVHSSSIHCGSRCRWWWTPLYHARKGIARHDCALLRSALVIKYKHFEPVLVCCGFFLTVR